MSVRPGQLASLVQSGPGRDYVLDELEKLKKAVKDLQTARSADFTTVGQGGTFTVDGTADVTGDINVSGAAAFSGDTIIGGTLNVAADTTLGGDTAISGDLTVSGETDLGGTVTITGTEESSNYVAGTSGLKINGATGNAEFNDLTLRGGIIGNDALTNPVTVDSYNGTTTALTLTTTPTVLHTETVTVPAGFTTAHVLAVVSVGGTNNGGSGGFADDNVHASVVINGIESDIEVEGIADGAAGHSRAAFASDVTGLTGGGTFAVSAKGYTQAASWTGSTARVSAMVTFIR